MKLPAKMHFKHGAYYYVHQNKWTKLSRDYPEALRKYSSMVSSVGVGMESLLDRFLLRQTGEVATSTLAVNRNAVKRLKTIFAEFSPEQVQPKHIFALRNEYKAKPAWANRFLYVLKGAFNLAIEEGLIVANPVRDVTNLKEKKRDRYITTEEFNAIREQANESMKAIMDVAYLTGQRIGDVLAIKLKDLREDGIYFRQSKTGTELIVGWSPELRKAVADAKQIHASVKGFSLFRTRQGNQLAYRTVHDFWNNARLKAGLVDCRIHDLRAKAGTDARKQGQDSKALLGHKSDSSHNRYIRDPDVPIVEAVRKKT